MNDPFGAAPAPAQPEPQYQPDEAQTETQGSPWDSPPPEAAKPAPAPRPVVAGSDGKVVLTFKGGSGFDAPWIVVHATDLDDALGYLDADNAPKFMDLMTRVQNAGQHFAALGGSAPKAPSGGGQQRPHSNAPQAAQEAPNGEKRWCAHGEMLFKTDVSKKTGKPYSGWFCTERNRDQQCEAQWPNKK